MSNSEKPRGYQPAKMTIEDIERLSKLFKDLFAEQPLIKYSIYAAGLAGAVEVGRALIEIIKFFAH